MHKILWLCGTGPLAKRRQEQFGDPDDVKFICVGAALRGYGFDEIVLDDITNLSHEQKDYLRTYLPTKLFPKGEIKILTLAHLE